MIAFKAVLVPEQSRCLKMVVIIMEGSTMVWTVMVQGLFTNENKQNLKGFLRKRSKKTKAHSMGTIIFQDTILGFATTELRCH